MGRGQGDGDIGTLVWGLGTWGRETRDLRPSSMGRGDVWDGDAGDAGCEWLLQKLEVNAISVTFLVNMFWWRQPTVPLVPVLNLYTASSRRIALYSSSDFSRRYPSEISFLTDQLALPTPRGTQVCRDKGFRLFKQASGRSGKVSPRTKELLF